MPLSTIFQCRKSEKIIDLSEVTDKLDHIMLYRTHLAMSEMKFELTTLEAIGTPGISHDTVVFHTKNLVSRSFCNSRVP